MAKEVPTPRTKEKEVDFSSNSPIVTTLKNQSIGTLPSVTGGTTTQPKSPPRTRKPPVRTNGQVFTPQPPPKTVKTTRGRGGNVSDLINKFNQT
jgi:hypothetical protein